ncbi:MAG: hypothetical protein GX594_02475 [Pirellulaceae bacterium]|nr:hypothetical protein [Pirellulaceae bacterium]
MSFSRHSFFRSLRGLGTPSSAPTHKPRRSPVRFIHGRRLRLEPLEDRSLLSVGVGGMVWHDLNADGIRSLDEPGIAAAVAEVFSSADEIIGNADDVSLGVAITDAEGLYSFADLPEAANYYVVFRTPVGYEFTAQDAGGDDSLDSDANATGMSTLLSVEAGENDIVIDAGLVGEASASDWSFSIGDSLYAEYSGGNAVAVDGEGNVYIVGRAQTNPFEAEPSEIDLDPGPGTTMLLSEQAFVAKYTSAGALVWASYVAPDTSSESEGIDLAVTSNGTVFATGNYYDTNSGDRGVFVTQLDNGGNVSWQKIISYDPTIIISNKATAIAMADDGSVCITGCYRGTVDFNPGPGVYELTSEGFWDGFVLKLNSEGTFVWAASIGGTGSDYVHDVDIDADGNVYVTGSYEFEVDFDPGEGEYFLTANEITDSGMFVLRLDSTGDFVWAKSAAGTGDTSGYSIVSAADGSVYVAGSFRGSTDFGLGEDSYVLEPIQNTRTVFVLKMDSLGDLVWADRMNAPYYDGGSIEAALGANGNLYVLAGRGWSKSRQYPPDVFVSGPTLYQFYYVYVSAIWDADGSARGIVELARQQTSGTILDGFSRPSDGLGMVFSDDGSLYATYTLGFHSLFAEENASIFVQKYSELSAPTDILLSSTTVDDGLGVGTLVGELSVDTTSASDYSYSLVSGEGDDDNDSFTIDGFGRLLTADIFDAAVKDSYSIRVRATDNYGQYNEKVFTITVVNVPYGLTLESPKYANVVSPIVTVGLAEGVENVLDGTTIWLDVDRNFDGVFESLGYATATFDNETATFQITPELSDGDFQLRARSTDQFGEEIFSPAVAMVIDTKPPHVHLSAPESTNDQQQSIIVNAQEGMTPNFTPAGSGLADYATAYLDVDLNNDGDFNDEGEAGYTTATLVDGAAAFNVSPALAEGTYNLRARVSDAAGNEGESNVAVMVVDLSAPTVFIGEPSAESTEYGPVTFIVTYDDANFDVSTLTAADVTLVSTGTAVGTVTVDDGAGKVRIVTISDITGEGTLSISIDAGTASDRAGNFAPAAGPSAAVNVVSTAHRIGDVVVVEAVESNNNDVLENTDKLLITWAVRGVDATPNVELLVGGQKVSTIYGPYMSADGAYMFAGVFGPLAAGTHSYTIKSLDGLGDATTRAGEFNVSIPAVAGPTISKVVVAESASGGNKILESNEQGVITWNVNSPAGVASRTVKIDGQNVSTIYGPYSNNYAAVFGPLSAGQHEYTIQVTDNNGVTTTEYGAFTVQAVSVAGPTISKVVVAESASGGNKILESNEQGVLTWNVNSPAGVASRTVKIDGQNVSAIYGPYSNNYAAVFGPLSAGQHEYTIQATDRNGVTTTEYGTFSVQAAAPGLNITNVVVADRPGFSDGDKILETNEQLVITWHIDSTAGVASRSLKVNGQSVSLVGGPDASGNCYGVFGPLPAATYSYLITVADQSGGMKTHEGSFNVLAALTLDAQAGPSGFAAELTETELASVAVEAARRWQTALGAEATAALAGVSFVIADLPGNLLGTAVDGTIRIDRDAAGYGWFVDSTPDEDEEFIGDAFASQVARDNTAAVGRADLLTAVLHEFGHLLGFEHDEAGLMGDLLPLSTRRTQ